MKPMELGKTEQTFKLFLSLLILHFLNGILFDFLSTIYAFFLLKTPLHYPGFATLSTSIWLFVTCLIFLKILKLYGYNKFNIWIFVIYFIFIYSAGIQAVGNSIQINLWHIGYQDNLAHELPYPAHLATVPTVIMPIFKLLYFYDEYLGHFLLFSGYFAFFLVFYAAGFSEKKQPVLKKHLILFYSSAILNGLFIAWNIVEGQSIFLFSLITAIMIGIYLYQHTLNHYLDQFSKQIQAIFLIAWIYIFVWFALIGHFHSLPQFFETMVSILRIKI